MSGVLAIDFGTTNTVVAKWISAQHNAETVSISGLSRRYPLGPPAIPSVIFFDDTLTGGVRLGNYVFSSGADQHPEAGIRLFRSMKRGVLSPEWNTCKEFDSTRVTSTEAAGLFLKGVCQSLLATVKRVDELILTAPVMAFEQYLRWLASAIRGLQLPSNVIPRVIDEPTAAAFGYQLDLPGGHVLVIDFGGGTLDLSLVQLPSSFDHASRGIVVPSGTAPEVAFAQARAQIAARVIAKTSRRIGGDDIDDVFVDWLLGLSGWSRKDVQNDIPLLLRLVEEAKIELGKSSDYVLIGHLNHSKKDINRKITRQEFERYVLDSPAIGLRYALREAIETIIADASRRSIGEQNIDKVLLVGGSTLIPAVQDIIYQRFGDKIIIRSPFEAVAHGALRLATSHPLEDILQHSYVLEVKRPSPSGIQEYDYEVVIRAGTSYPLDSAVHLENYLKPVADGVTQIEFIIAELAEEGEAGERVVYDVNGRKLSDRCRPALAHNQVIRQLRDKYAVVLDPPGRLTHEDRLEVSFTVDENRRLRMTVFDRVANRWLTREEAIARLE